VEYLRRLAEGAGGDTDLAFELGNAYMRVARVQGVPVSFNLGQIDQADESLRMAEKFMGSVRAAQPANRVAMLRSAQIALDRMSLASLRRRNEETLTFARKSEEWLAKYESTGKIDPSEATVVANTYLNLGNRYAFLDQFDQAVRLSRHAKDIALAAGNRSTAGGAMWALANALHRKGDVEEALQAIRESVRLLESAPQTTKSLTEMSVAGALITEGMILASHTGIGVNRPEEAIAPLERVIAISDAFAGRDVNDSESRNRLFAASMVLGQIMVKKDAGRALEIYDHTLDRLAELPKNASARRKEAWILANSTYALRKLGRNAEARRRLDLCLAHLKELNLYPADGIPPEVNEALRALGDHEAATGSIPKAIEVFDDLRRRIAAGNPETGLEAAVELSSAYTELIGLHRRIGQNEPASDLETRRLELWRRWSAKLPNNSLVSRQLADASKPIQTATASEKRLQR
jgi:tetratricopeptide (TPR) repeat protein